MATNGKRNALLDGFGVGTLIGDSTIPLERARKSVSASLAAELGLGERLVATGSRDSDSESHLHGEIHHRSQRRA